MSSLDPEDVLLRLGIDYQDKNNRLAIHCPFHHDTNPSSGIYEDTKLFHCFACELTLDLIGFYAKVKEIDRKQAMKELLDGIDPDPGLKPDRMLIDGVDLQSHAALAEMSDKVILFYQRGRIDAEKLEHSMSRWYTKVEEVRDGLQG